MPDSLSAFPRMQIKKFFNQERHKCCGPHTLAKVATYYENKATTNMPIGLVESASNHAERFHNEP